MPVPRENRNAADSVPRIVQGGLAGRGRGREGRVRKKRKIDIYHSLVPRIQNSKVTNLKGKRYEHGLTLVGKEL